MDVVAVCPRLYFTQGMNGFVKSRVMLLATLE